MIPGVRTRSTAMKITNRISHAFKLLRKEGYLTRQKFACCASCAYHTLKEVMEEKAARGFAYYHRQAARDMAEGKDFYIHYAGATYANDVTVGKAICKALEQARIAHTWNGAGTQAIQVCTEDALLPAVEG